MKVETDREKCIGECLLCFEACPKLPNKTEELRKHSKERLLDFFESSNIKERIKNQCPENAFKKIKEQNTKTIKPEKCSNCKFCVEKTNGAIIEGKEKPYKCDLCADQQEYKCIEACPYNALEITHTEKEKKKLKEKIGYRIDKTKKGTYKVKEENYSIQEARVIDKILERIREKDSSTEKEEIEAEVEKECLEMNLKITEEHVKKLSKHINREINGLSILEKLLKDTELEEISIIAPEKPVYVYHREEGWKKTNLKITNSEKIKNLINKSARKLNRRITFKEPRLNANIDKGRIHGAIKPLATTGNCMTIRKFTANQFKPEDLVQNSTIPRKIMNLIKKTIKCDTNILIAGNTGSGKTTTLNTILHFLPRNERIVIVEETPEISPPQDHVIRLTTSTNLKIQMHELVADTLRMRPDRIIVGEVRDKKEAEALMDTMLAGQGKGSMATFHGNSAEETITRLESLGIHKNDLVTIDLILIQRRWIEYQEEEDNKEKREIIEAAVMDKKTKKPLKIYEKNKGIIRKNLKDSKLMKKLELSYQKDQSEIIKQINGTKNGSEQKK